MPRPFYMFHKEYAPEGRIFDEDDGHTPQSLVPEGWVDSPAKIGVNLSAPGDPVVDKGVAEIAAAFEAKLIPAVDDPHFQSAQLREQAEETVQALAARDEALREAEDLRERLRLSEQRFADMESDGNKLAGRPDPEHQVQVPDGAPTGTGNQGTGEGTGNQGEAPDAGNQGGTPDDDEPTFTDAEIREAILQLGPAEFTQSGLPRVEAIEAKLAVMRGLEEDIVEISGTRRDTVWAQIEAEKEAAA